jgi:hypothetical protein
MPNPTGKGNPISLASAAADVRFDVASFAVVIGGARNGPRMNGDQQQASGTALLAIVNRRAVLGAGARPSRVTACPFVKSARLLSAEGHPADAVIEMWRPNTDAWALRGLP